MKTERTVLRGIGSSGTPRNGGFPSRDTSPNRIVRHDSITAQFRGNLCSDLALRSGPAESRIKESPSKGAVWIKRRRGRRRRVRRVTTRLKNGDNIGLSYDAAILERTAPEPECIGDHGGFSIWCTPAGMLPQGTLFGDHCRLMRAARKLFNDGRPNFPAHRLDCEAQGLVLIDHDRTAVEIRLESGRRHQIQRHCNAIGQPVLGDPRYGRGNIEPCGLRLWAFLPAFTCPQCQQPHGSTRAPAFAVRADAADIHHQRHRESAS